MQPKTEDAREQKWLVRLVPALIVLLAVIAYAPSLRFKYVQDAFHLVKTNPVVERGDPVEILSSDFCKDTPSQARSLYRPVTIASYVLERRIAGEASPALSHLFGIVFHVLTALVLFLLARRLGARDATAAAAALIFAVHPLMMQGVVNVAARADLLVTLFSLASLLCYSWAGQWPRGLESGRATRRLAAWGAALCVILALGSKEPAVALPLLLLAMDALYRFPGRGGGAAWWIERVAALAPSALACVVYIVLRTGAIESLWGLPGAPVEDNVLASGLPASSYWATVLAILARYAGLFFWPVGMSGDYSGSSIPAESSLLAPLPLAGLALAAVLLVLLFTPLVRPSRGRPSARLIPMGALLFVLPYLVIGNVLALNAAALAERWLYFPAAGATLLVATGLCAVARSTPWLRSRTGGIVAGLLLVLLCAGGALYTRHASRMWENNIAFFSQNLRATPKSLRAYIVLGQRHRELGELEAALDLYERALGQAPDHVPFWIEKGVTLWRMNRLGEAEGAFRRAVELRPDMGQAWMNLGLILARRGAVVEAEPALRKALVYEPYLVRAAEALGDLAFGDGRYSEAAQYYDGCVRLGRNDLRPKLAAATRLAAESRRPSLLMPPPPRRE